LSYFCVSFFMTVALTEILDKISELFLSYGIRSMTMDNISSELGISKKTLYQHVKNKEDLIRQVIHYEYRKRSFEVKKIIKEEHNAIEQLFEIHKLIISFIKKYSSAIEYDLKKYNYELNYK